MEAVVKNVRGCVSAELVIEKICLLAGQNDAGKSSTIQAIGCALTGSLSAIAAIAKKDLKGLVHDGAEDGHVVVRTTEGSVAMVYPKGEASTSRLPPKASRFAVGLDSLADMDVKSRSKVLADDYLTAVPTKEDLKAALADINLADEQFERIWERVELRGWDGAGEEAKESGTKLKGSWESTTRDNYGSKKAASWTPPGWTPDLEAADIGILTAATNGARAALETAISSSAIATADRERLVAAAGDFDAAVKAVADANDAVTDNPVPGPNGGLPCPHCNGLVTMSPLGPGQWRIAKAQKIADAEHKKLRDAAQAAEGGRRDAERRLATATKARDDLDAAKRRSGDPAVVEAARAALAAADAKEKMVQTYHAAKALHQRVERSVVIVEALSEKGVRRTKLLECLDAFNRERLLPICQAAGWQPVRVEEDLGFTYGTRPYALLSESQRWRLRAVLAIAMAQIDKSELICLDGADILVPERRSELFAMLDTLTVPVIVGMSMGAKQKVPDLAAAGYGRTYMIVEGVAAAVAA